MDFENKKLEKELGNKTINQIRTKLSAYLAVNTNDNYLGYVMEYIKHLFFN